MAGNGLYHIDCSIPSGPALGQVFDSTRLRGVSWVGGDSVTEADLAPLLRDHITWIAQMPFGWQAGATEPGIRANTGRPVGRRGLVRPGTCDLAW